MTTCHPLLNEEMYKRFFENPMFSEVGLDTAKVINITLNQSSFHEVTALNTFLYEIEVTVKFSINAEFLNHKFSFHDKELNHDYGVIKEDKNYLYEADCSLETVFELDEGEAHFIEYNHFWVEKLQLKNSENN